MLARAQGDEPPPDGPKETWLVIEVPDVGRVIERLPHEPSIVMVRYADLSGDLVDRVHPARILCPLFSPTFDAFDVLRQISRAQWRGKVSVITHPLPNQRMVERELRAKAHGLQVELLPI